MAFTLQWLSILRNAERRLWIFNGVYRRRLPVQTRWYNHFEPPPCSVYGARCMCVCVCTPVCMCIYSECVGLPLTPHTPHSPPSLSLSLSLSLSVCVCVWVCGCVCGGGGGCVCILFVSLSWLRRHAFNMADIVPRSQWALGSAILPCCYGLTNVSYNVMVR